MNKKLFAALLALCLTLSLCACGGTQTPETTEAPTEAPAVVLPAPETEAPAENENPTYMVTIQDTDGNPIAGAMVQLCMETCFPGIADAQGVARFQVPEADYKVSFLSLPAGYTYSTEEQEFYFESGALEMTIVLKAEA